MRNAIAEAPATTEHEHRDVTRPYATPRCGSVCGKLIDPAHNPGMLCQSQCDQREGHPGGHNCPTHGFF